MRELRDHVAHEIGPIAKPRQIMLTPELPKTRSGKIMRRLLRDVAEHRDLGDVTTLLDPTVVNAIKERMADGAEDSGIGPWTSAGFRFASGTDGTRVTWDARAAESGRGRLRGR